MIGNDVVDLKQARRESDWRRPGFLQRVFTSSELVYINQAQDADQMVWLLWSMKEASYKAHQRRYDLPRRLDWQAQECFIDTQTAENAKGRVRIGKEWYQIHSQLNRNFVLSVATCEEGAQFRSICDTRKADKIKAVLLGWITKSNKAGGRLCIEKNLHGVPSVYLKNEEVFNRFSFSGHGRFYAVAFQPNESLIRVKES